MTGTGKSKQGRNGQVWKCMVKLLSVQCWNCMSQNCSANQTKGLSLTPSSYFIIHVQHQLCGYQINMCRNEEKLKKYLHKVWTWDFIEHIHICHSMLCHFRDRGFSGGRPKKNFFIVRCSTNSTNSSAIYKYTSELVGWLKFYIPYTVSGSWVLGLAG